MASNAGKQTSAVKVKPDAVTSNSIVDLYLGSKLKNVSEVYKSKLSDVFGISWENVKEFLGQNMSKDDATILIMMAPIVVKSMTAKDGGKSAALLSELSSLNALAKFKIVGRAGSTDDLNKTLLRVSSLVLIHYHSKDAFPNDKKLGKAYVAVSKLQSVLNDNGNLRSDDAMKVIREVSDKLGSLSSEMKSELKQCVAKVFTSSAFK